MHLWAKYLHVHVSTAERLITNVSLAFWRKTKQKYFVEFCQRCTPYRVLWTESNVCNVIYKSSCRESIGFRRISWTKRASGMLTPRCNTLTVWCLTARKKAKTKLSSPPDMVSIFLQSLLFFSSSRTFFLFSRLFAFVREFSKNTNEKFDQTLSSTKWVSKTSIACFRYDESCFFFLVSLFIQTSFLSNKQKNIKVSIEYEEHRRTILLNWFPCFQKVEHFTLPVGFFYLLFLGVMKKRRVETEKVKGRDKE